MIQFIIYGLILLVALFLASVLLSLMLWVIMKLLRFLFPAKFVPDKKRAKDKV